jgi:hypothetical protein
MAMDNSATLYIKIVLDVLVAVVVALVLFLLARRARKEQTFVGFKDRSADEKYVGYGLFAVGIILIIVSGYELIMLLNGGVYSETPFNLSSISIGGQVISGQVLGLSLAVDFWLTILGYGGRKFVSLGLDMLNGKKVTLRRTQEKT